MIVAPTGVPNIIETIIPIKAHIIEMIAEEIVTDLKLLKTLIEQSAGNIIRAETKSEPTRFIATTITIAIIVASIVLNKSIFVPQATAKFSSNVTANILL